MYFQNLNCSEFDFPEIRNDLISQLKSLRFLLVSAFSDCIIILEFELFRIRNVSAFLGIPILF